MEVLSSVFSWWLACHPIFRILSLRHGFLPPFLIFGGPRLPVCWAQPVLYLGWGAWFRCNGWRALGAGAGISGSLVVGLRRHGGLGGAPWGRDADLLFTVSRDGCAANTQPCSSCERYGPAHVRAAAPILCPIIFFSFLILFFASLKIVSGLQNKNGLSKNVYTSEKCSRIRKMLACSKNILEFNKCSQIWKMPVILKNNHEREKLYANFERKKFDF